MKVVPKITVLDRILEQIDHYKSRGRAIDYVAVHHAEYAELRAEFRYMNFVDYPHCYYKATDPVVAMSMETRDFELVNKAAYGYGRDYSLQRRRYVSNEKICGVPLFVVDKDYFPV
jgi:hypothetical protein